MSTETAQGRIVIDAVFFQLAGSGIARVWRNLFEQWAGTEFGSRLVVLDRAGSAPKYQGLRYRQIPPFDYREQERDRGLLQAVCDAEEAALFVSTYYTTPLSTRSALLLYDMIPELFGMDMSSPQWRQKTDAIRYASHYLAISRSTAADLLRISEKSTYDLAIAHCGCNFAPPAPGLVGSFRQRYGIDRPYFMLSGTRSGYKNGILFFEAFSRLAERRKDFAIVCTGGDLELEEDCLPHLGEARVHMLRLSDEEIQCAYAGAVALVYPSLYEGFGMPPLEAMACGTAVITCPRASLPEVCGDGAIYVEPDREGVDGMYRALLTVLDPDRRMELIERGFRQAARFSWREMAQTVAANLGRWAVKAAPAASTVAAATSAPRPLLQSMEVAFALFNAGDHAGADGLCRELIASGAANFYPYYLSGIVAALRQDWGKARSHLQEALSLAEGIPAERVAEASSWLAGLPQG